MMKSPINLFYPTADWRGTCADNLHVGVHLAAEEKKRKNISNPFPLLSSSLLSSPLLSSPLLSSPLLSSPLLSSPLLSSPLPLSLPLSLASLTSYLNSVWVWVLQDLNPSWEERKRGGREEGERRRRGGGEKEERRKRGGWMLEQYLREGWVILIVHIWPHSCGSDVSSPYISRWAKRRGRGSSEDDEREVGVFHSIK